jgi:ABC-2 type transport system ATP-binding protein
MKKIGTNSYSAENKFFILDEPFNGVDIQSNIIITELILKLKELGRLFSFHLIFSQR